eukprot:1088573-Prorocentrum_lima.AAC.1
MTSSLVGSEMCIRDRNFIPLAPPMPPPNATSIFDTTLPSYLTQVDDIVATRGGGEVGLLSRP